MKRVVLHVDRLVLRGFRGENRAVLADSLRHELGRQFQEDPVAARGLATRSDAARLEIPPMYIPRAAPAARIGTRVARAIARGMKS